MQTFETYKDLLLPEPLSKALDKMGFIRPTPVQAQAIPVALEGRDVLGTAQTGTGKTAAFGIPLLVKLYTDTQRQALILAPTRELAAQIHHVLRLMGKRLNIYGTLVVGGESFGRQVDELDRGVDYVVATPGRLVDHIDEGTFDPREVGYVVLDEVDRMLDMGFIPQVKRVLRDIPRERQTMLFSATLPKEITGLAASFLRDPVRIAIGSPAETVAKITETTIRTPQDRKSGVLLEQIAAREGKILVFARTKSRAERLARMLGKQGHRAVRLHGGRNQSQRKRALEDFRSGDHRIMVATDLAGRGIDVPDIEHVINYDLPATREDYIHRIGRTGRLGREGQALNLLVPGDIDGEKVIGAKSDPAAARATAPARAHAPGRPTGSPTRGWRSRAGQAHRRHRGDRR